MKLVFIVVMSFVLMGCPSQEDQIDSMLILRNFSGNAIVHSVEINLPSDTTLADISYPLSAENIGPLTLNSMESDTLSESFIKILSEDFPDHRLMVFFLSKDTIDLVPWDRIVDENLILRRFDLTLGDLESMDWTIVYP